MSLASTYRFLALFACVLISLHALSQSVPVSATCNGATGICTGSAYSFPAGVNAGTAQIGANYGCLKTQPNPAWFFMRIKSAGSIRISMSSSPARDIDFILWGPFASPTAPCVTGLDTTKIVDCSYSTASVENADIPNAVAGGYYIMMITNYSNRSTDITFSQTGGSGVSDCDVLCNIKEITTRVSACDTLGVKGAYRLSGTISLFSPPSTGTLTISSSCGGSVTLNAPFANTINYIIPNITGKGDSCYVTASFSAVGTCSRTVVYAAPKCCTMSAVTPVSSCPGQTIQLQASGTSGGIYHWAGPSNFSGSGASPVITNASPNHAGTYPVFLTHGSCTTDTIPVLVSIKPAPDTSLTFTGLKSFCVGDSLTIKASSDSGLVYQWQQNSSNITAAVSKQYTAKSSGNYRVYLTGSNGCSLYSSQVQVTANSYPDTALTASGPLTFCSGESITLQVPYDSSATYSWYYNNILQQGSQHTFNVAQSGFYKTIINKNGCVRGSKIAQVNVIDKPVRGSIRHYQNPTGQ